MFELVKGIIFLEVHMWQSDVTSIFAREGSSNQPKMVAPLLTYTATEQQSVTCFLCSKGINCEMTALYGDSYLSLQQVLKWHRNFKSSVTSVGRLTTSTLC